MRSIRIFLIALPALAALFSLSARAQDQTPSADPVADAARRARAQKDAAAKPKRIFTNDDIPSALPPVATPPAESKSPQNAAQDDSAAATKEDPEENPKSESYWRKKFAKARAKLAQAEKERDLLQRELEQSQVQYYPDPQKALAEQNNRADINEKRSKLDAKQKEIDSLKQGLGNLEDDLRKSGGDPGWSR